MVRYHIDDFIRHFAIFSENPGKALFIWWWVLPFFPPWANIGEYKSGSSTMKSFGLDLYAANPGNEESN